MARCVTPNWTPSKHLLLATCFPFLLYLFLPDPNPNFLNDFYPLSPALTLIQNLLPPDRQKAVKIEFSLLICRDIRSIDPRTFVSAYVLEPIICEFCAERKWNWSTPSIYFAFLLSSRFGPKDFYYVYSTVGTVSLSKYIDQTPWFSGIRSIALEFRRMLHVCMYGFFARGLLSRYILAEKRTSLRPFRFAKLFYLNGESILASSCTNVELYTPHLPKKLGLSSGFSLALWGGTSSVWRL